MIAITREVKDPIIAVDVISTHIRKHIGLQMCSPRVVEVLLWCSFLAELPRADVCLMILCAHVFLSPWCSLGSNPSCIAHGSVGRNSQAVRAALSRNNSQTVEWGQKLADPIRAALQLIVKGPAADGQSRLTSVWLVALDWLAAGLWSGARWSQRQETWLHRGTIMWHYRNK